MLAFEKKDKMAAEAEGAAGETPALAAEPRLASPTSRPSRHPRNKDEENVAADFPRGSDEAETAAEPQAIRWRWSPPVTAAARWQPSASMPPPRLYAGLSGDQSMPAYNV